MMPFESRFFSTCRTLVIAVLLTLGCGVGPVAADSVLPANVRDALARLEVQSATDFDRALLFKYNDDINAAALNGEISDQLYQAAQRDYAATNRRFAADAAAQAGADFTVQNPTAPEFSPGTDSDYITVVRSEDQIADMQRGYNQRVNDYLDKHGINREPRGDWHKKLDTDFMGDPRYVSETEFRKIAQLNNDAYTRRHAAEFEAIIRKPGGPGKIDPQHIVAYAEEMDDFARKKGKLLDKMLANPSRFNDPRTRADAFRTMAQQQKYTSRIQMAEDLLRAQEGLPPRARGPNGSISKIGSKRSWANSGNIRDAYQVADKSLASSIDSLTDTMAEVAKKNPRFRARAGKDIAALVDRLPEGQRSAALDRIRSRHGAGFADEVADAVRSRGTGFAGLDDAKGLGAADDMKAVGKLDDATRSALSVADDAAEISKLRAGFNSLSGIAMEALGAIGVGADLYAAAQQAKVVLAARREALDPKLTDAEAEALFEKAQQAANGLIESGLMGALMERYPPFAAAYGTWTLTRHGGEWVLANTETGQAINRAATDYLDRHMRAAEQAKAAITEYLGGESERMKNAARITELCAGYTKAIGEGRIRLKKGKKSVDVCNYIREGNLVGIQIDLIDQTPEPKPVAEVDPCKSPNTALSRVDALIGAGSLGAAGEAVETISPGNCEKAAEAIAERRKTIGAKIEALLDAARSSLTSCEGQTAQAMSENLSRAGHPRLAGLGAELARFAPALLNAEAAFARARAAFRNGDMSAARSGLESAKTDYERLGADAGCEGEVQKITVAASKVERMASAVSKIDAATHACDLDRMSKFHTQLAGLKKPHPVLVRRAAALGSEIRACKDNNPELQKIAADADCKARHGSGYFAGSIAADGSYRCLPDKATATAWCNSNNQGSGWFATRVQPDGTYDCRRTKAARNAVCRKEFGSGWYAGKTDARGQFRCYMGKTARANACRKKYGKGWTAGKLKRDGGYNCYPPKAKRGKTVRRKTAPKTSRSANNDAAAAAAAAAIAGAIINGIVQSQGGGGSRSNCHRNPTTGQLHCGSN